MSQRIDALRQRIADVVMTPRTENIRWRLARLLNCLPGQCWAELATWSMSDDPGRLSPWSSNTECRADAARIGCCWCGKYRDEAGFRRWEEHVAGLQDGEFSP